MQDIKPIETVYNGYRFRSRLEARWAVFFDALNIAYEYEPEGFELHDGEYYLPDFYLRDFNLYVEIKPINKAVFKHVGDGNVWEQKCENFRDSTNMAILLCYGSPSDDIYKRLFAYDLTEDGGGSSEWDVLFVLFCGKVVICTEPTRSDRTIYINASFEENDRVGTPATFAKDYDLLWERALVGYHSDMNDDLNNAMTLSRQARFEHGEKPTF